MSQNAKKGRAKVTDNILEVNRMLNKKDVTTPDGKTISRRKKLFEILWRRVIDTNGEDSRALHTLLEYAGGKPTTIDKLPQDEESNKGIDNILDTPDFVKEIENELLQNAQPEEPANAVDSEGLPELTWQDTQTD